MTPILIVGAGRSGTNLLAATFERESPRFRNLVENRYVWNYGQRQLSTDHRSPAEATERVRAYIRRHFARLGNSPDARLIDKTPGNALRIPFVAAVFPEAKFINIVRDGRDNIISRALQWDLREKPTTAGGQPGEQPGRVAFMARRLSHFRTLVGRGNIPPDRIPAVLRDMVPEVAAHMVTGRPRRYAERVAGAAETRAIYGVDAAAAVQWRDVVMMAHADGKRLGPGRYLEIRYEHLVADAPACWRSIMEFLEIEETGAGAEHLARTIRPQQGADWRTPGPERERILALEGFLRPTLEYLGYEWE